jgi:hypothetical protein
LPLIVGSESHGHRELGLNVNVHVAPVGSGRQTRPTW